MSMSGLKRTVLRQKRALNVELRRENHRAIHGMRQTVLLQKAVQNVELSRENPWDMIRVDGL